MKNMKKVLAVTAAVAMTAAMIPSTVTFSPLTTAIRIVVEPVGGIEVC